MNGPLPLDIEPEAEVVYDDDPASDEEFEEEPAGLQSNGSTKTYLRRPDGEPYAIVYTYPNGDYQIIDL